jgi:molybdenum ABC transporter molybdate-binding protein
MRLIHLICIAIMASFAVHARAEALPIEPVIDEITVLADDSLQLPLVELARLHSIKTNVSVTLWFTPASSMVSAIRDGADVDIVITADTNTLRTLETMGQMDVHATKIIATCPLVIAVRKDGGSAKRDIMLELTGLNLHSNEHFSLVTITAPERSEATMSEHALSLSELLKDRKLNLISANDPRDAMARMKDNDAPALLLAIDVFSHTSLSLVQRFPPSIVPPAQYRAAVLAGEHMDAAREFISATSTPEYRAIFTQYGLGDAE